MLTRRELIKRGAIGGGALMVPWVFDRSAMAGVASSYKTNLADYLPPLAKQGANGLYNMDINTLAERVVHQKAALAPTNVWAYETDDKVWPWGNTASESWLGPLLQVGAGEGAEVLWRNGTQPGPHLFSDSIDKAVLDPYAVGGNAQERRFLTHLHGAYVDGEFDGNPFAAHYDHEEVAAEQFTRYPAQDRAALIWYHQHAHGITHLNVYAGLAGGYLIRDDKDTGGTANPLGLPAIPYELPLVLQDRTFKMNKLTGALGLVYPPAPWVPEFFGDTMCVNGAIEPFHRVEPRRYRFRMINGCNARFLNLEFRPASISGTVPSVFMIGGDGGLLPEPARWGDGANSVANIVAGPGERLDLIVDFTGCVMGDKLQMKNKKLPAGIVSPARPLSTVMRFDVGPLQGADNTHDFANGAPNGWPVDGNPLTALNANIARRRNMILEEVMGPAGPLASVINGVSFEGRPVTDWMEPATPYPFDKSGAEDVPCQENVKNGETEEWTFVNATADTHPMHVHLVQFGLVSRQAIDMARYGPDLMAVHEAQRTGLKAGDRGWPRGVGGAELILDQDGRLDPSRYLVPETLRQAPADEAGWKDTIRANPGEVTTIRAEFNQNAAEQAGDGTDPDNSGKFVFHCHILEHESNSMMRPFEVK